MFKKASLYAPAVEVDLIAGLARAKGPMTHLIPVHATGLVVEHRVSDGQMLDLGTQHVRVFTVPGHTAGSAAYLVGGALFTGDALGVTAAHALKESPRPTSDDADQNRASVRALGARLAAEHVTMLVPAHSGALEAGGIPAMLTTLP